MDKHDELKKQGEYLDQLIHRRGDLRTMIEDNETARASLIAEDNDVKGGIAMARKRVAALQQELAQAQQPKASPVAVALVPADVTEQKLAAAAKAAKELPPATAEKKA